MIACYSLLPEWSFDRLFKGRRVLHFAPERLVGHLVEQLASQYVTADFLDPACDLRLNMSRMDALGENSFDAVIACDVLEHVPDDLEAMRELQRILSPDGVAVLTVPQADHLTVRPVAIGRPRRSPAHLWGGLRRAAAANRFPRYAGG